MSGCHISFSSSVIRLTELYGGLVETCSDAFFAVCSMPFLQIRNVLLFGLFLVSLFSSHTDLIFLQKAYDNMLLCAFSIPSISFWITRALLHNQWKLTGMPFDSASLNFCHKRSYNVWYFIDFPPFVNCLRKEEGSCISHDCVSFFNPTGHHTLTYSEMLGYVSMAKIIVLLECVEKLSSRPVKEERQFL